MVGMIPAHAQMGGFGGPQLKRQLEERRTRIQSVRENIPEDHFGHTGWKQYISLKGDRRIRFGGLRITTGTGEACVQFAAYRVDTGEPFVTTFWQMWLGRNFDLAVDKAQGSFVLKDRPPGYELRAWGSPDSDIVYYLRADYQVQGYYC